MSKFPFPAFLSLAVLSLLAFSCSGYFDRDAGLENDKSLSPLAIRGGGYLSSDTADDITPFYYHDTNTGKNWLFFSSDRDGSYDLYYAEMNTDGSFQKPVKMDANINTTADEVSPVIYFGPYTLATVAYRQFVTFLRMTAGQTNLIVIALGSNFTYNSAYTPVSNVAYSRLSLFNQTNVDGNPQLMACGGKTNWFARGWGLGEWSTSDTTNGVSNSTSPIYSMNGYLEEWAVGANQYTNYYLIATSFGGKRQLYLARKGFGINRVDRISSYSSYYNDEDPDIDMFKKKVYFSSDRRGNYDLYRFNIVTYDKICKP